MSGPRRSNPRNFAGIAEFPGECLGDFRAPLTDPPGDLGVEGLAVESMTQDGLAVGLFPLCVIEAFRHRHGVFSENRLTR